MIEFVLLAETVVDVPRLPAVGISIKPGGWIGAYLLYRFGMEALSVWREVERDRNL